MAILLCLLVVTVMLYAPVRGYRFVNFDDDQYVTSQPQVLHGISPEGVYWAFTSFHYNNWHPFTTLSHMLDCELWGLNAGGHHLTNVFFHTVNTLLLFVILDGMTGALWRSAFVAALFAWHPLRVESVAWISDRKDLVSTLFLLLTVASYLWYARKPSWSRYLALSILYLMGLMSKAMLITLPALLLLLDYWPLGRVKFSVFSIQCSVKASRMAPDLSTLNTQQSTFSWLILEKLPLCLLGAVFGALTMVAQRQGGALYSLKKVSLSERLSNASFNHIAYIFKTIWPTDLVLPYPITHVPLWEALGCALLVIVITGSVLWMGRTHPFMPVGWFWYVVCLAPVNGLIHLGEMSRADRYTYVPGIGLFVIAAWGCDRLLRRCPQKRTLAVAGVVALLIGCIAVSAKQLSYWRNSVTLFEHALAAAPGTWVAHNNLANALANQGRVDEATTHRIQALSLGPDSAVVHNNYGNLMLAQGRVDEAVAHYEEALRLTPAYPEAHYNMAIVRQGQGRIEEAVRHYEEVVRLQPNDAQAHSNLANVLLSQGDEAGAIRHHREALRLLPGSPVANSNLAWVLATSNDPLLRDGRESLRLALRAAELTERKNPTVLDTLAAAYAETGRFDEAVATAQKAYEVAMTGHDSKLADEVQRRLALYERELPYRGAK